MKPNPPGRVTPTFDVALEKKIKTLNDGILQQERSSTQQQAEQKLGEQKSALKKADSPHEEEQH